MMKRPAALILVVAGLIGCGESDAGSEPPITQFADDDQEMVAAMRKARDTLPQFIKSLEAPAPNQTYFSIKGRFEENGKVEHIWLEGVKHDGKVFRGTIGNTPVSITTLKYGSPCAVPPDRVSDWMIIEDDRLIGGYTMRVARSRKSPKEREEFDRNVPFRFD